jgi:hypothetical protein
MLLLVESALLSCDHDGTGVVHNRPSQVLVRISGGRVLVETDPVGRQITGCDNIGIGMKPCTATLNLQQGYSDLLRVDGHRVCLDSVTGLTDGSPPGTVHYRVRRAGQDYVTQGSH